MLYNQIESQKSDFLPNVGREFPGEDDWNIFRVHRVTKCQTFMYTVYLLSFVKRNSLF